MELPLRLAATLLSFILPAEQRECILGDLAEEFLAAGAAASVADGYLAAKVAGSTTGSAALLLGILFLASPARGYSAASPQRHRSGLEGG